MTIDIQNELNLAQIEAAIGMLLREAQPYVDFGVADFVNQAYEAVGGGKIIALHPMAAVRAAYVLGQVIGNEEVTGFLGQTLAEYDRPGSGSGDDD